MASLPAILAAVDGSTQSMDTVTYLSHFLSPARVKIDLLHVLAEMPEAFLDQADLEGAVSYEREIGCPLRWHQLTDPFPLVSAQLVGFR